MITYSFEGKVLPTTYDTFIENVLNALFDIEPDPSLDILIRVSEAIEAQEGVAGLCSGDEHEITIDVATHFELECGESCEYQPHELASNIAHELVHARQFARNQINDVDYVWKRNGESINCEHVEYRDTPWEVEAYGLEVILTDLFWE
jgi:hypothetical protein|tara:strand:- start:175 stop:618 length:444 start_codon:yes stop_codon:yes gene_type:complete